MSHPTKAEVTAVQQALYKHKRMNKLKFLNQQISLLMNLNQSAVIQPSDPRSPAGSGPDWFIPDTGKIDPSVLEAANRCDQVAQTILDIRADVAAVKFPAADKAHLTKALHEEAASWTARASAWRASGSPNVNKLVAQIHNHLDTGVQEASHVKHYFKAYDKVLA